MAKARLVLLADTLLALFRQMAQVRAAEKRLVQSYQDGLIAGDCHSSLGQEAVATGICAHLRKNDLLFSPHRGHGHALCKGLKLEQLFGELYGRSTGCCRGRGGGRNLLSAKYGLLGSGGLHGASITEAVGAALALKQGKSERIAVAFFGEGAVLHGRFHEGANLAANWNLPMVLVCENNVYVDQSRFEDLTAQSRIAIRGRAYGIRVADVDGNDVTAVYEEAHEAVRLARLGEGPTLLECRTYRARPFVEGVEEKPSRPEGEREEWLANDPIVSLVRRILDSEFATREDLSKIEKQVVQEVLLAHSRAKEAPFPIFA
jgi:TPP-dependent pyruvate/acetoin dehydrogenase alpha subunit